MRKANKSKCSELYASISGRFYKWFVLLLVLSWAGCAGTAGRKAATDRAKQKNIQVNIGGQAAKIWKIGPDRPQRLVYFDNSKVVHHTLYLNRDCKDTSPKNRQANAQVKNNGNGNGKGKGSGSGKGDDNDNGKLRIWRKADAVCLLTGPICFIKDIIIMPVSMVRNAPWHHQASSGFSEPVNIKAKKTKKD